ncbi:MAG: hypothetical protein M9900_13055 [Flavobacteriales bacterium]|nr:hypothetical protein [Flavobacteriales bacterium]
MIFKPPVAMSFMSRIFQRAEKDTATKVAVAPVDLANPTTTLVEQELFIDREPPSPTKESMRTLTRLEELASTDHREAGRLDGFTYHDMTICGQGIERIKAEIRCALEQEVNRIGRFVDLLDVEIRKIQDTGSANLLLDLQANRDQMERDRYRLNEQQMLVVGNSGLADLPTTTYEAGFRQGYREYLESMNFILKYQG